LLRAPSFEHMAHANTSLLKKTAGPAVQGPSVGRGERHSGFRSAAAGAARVTPAATPLHGVSPGVTPGVKPDEPLTLLVVTNDAGFTEDVARAARVDEIATCMVVPPAAAANMLKMASFHTILIHANPPETDVVCEAIRSMGIESNIVATFVRRNPAITASTLESGADDVFTWPVPLSELIARMAAWARRARGTRLGPLRIGDIAIDEPRCSAFVQGRAVALRKTELRLLTYLMRNPERVLSPEEIVANVLGTHHAPDSSLVRVHIAHLREKLGSARERIRTIRGLGYLLTAAPSLSCDDECELQPNRAGRSVA
jgi:two-component system, OmpR family, response regulator